MAVRVSIPTALRQYAGGNNTINIDGGTVGEVLQTLMSQHPDLGKQLMQNGEVRNFVNIYLNDDDVRYLQGMATPIAARDEISIIPAIAGGSSQTATELTHEEIRRYSRHLIMPEVGPAGQRKLKQASILLVGTGGLGSPLALYLAAAGVGHLGLVDFDVVDESNLQRQIIHGTASLGISKIESARARIADLNPLVEVTTYETNLTSDNAFDIIRPYDIVIDGTDNFPTRYLVNDACVLLHKPNVYGSIFRFEGQASVFAVEDGPCYRCLYPEPPPPGLVPSCAEGGVLGVLPGIIGTIQATEAIKLIIGKGTPLIGRLMLFDALDMRFRELKLRKNPNCPVCGTNPTVTELIDYEVFCGLGDIPVGLPAENRISPQELAETLAHGNGDRPLLLDVREDHEWDIVHLDDARLISVNTLAGHLDEIPRDEPIVVYCKSGARSARATQLLKDAGFQKVRNLDGGITRWAQEIDTSLPTY